MTGPPPRRRGALDVAAAGTRWAVVAFAALAGLMMLWWPLGHDQGIFALNGAVVAAGGMPYRDAFETRGPLAFYLFALLRLAFGPHAWGVRLVDLGVAATTALLLFRLLAPLGSRAAGWLAGAGWVLAVVSLGHQDAAQLDLWIGTAVLGGALLVAREPRYRARDLAAFGLLVGLASLTKQLYPVLLAVPGAVVLWRRQRDVAGVARDAGVLLLAWLAPIALTLAWFWARGGLADLWEAHMTYTLRVYPVYAGDSRAARLPMTLSFLLRSALVPTALCAAAAGLASLWRDRRALALALAAAVACGLVVVVLQGRFFPYHWAVLLPPLAALAAVGCADAARGPGPGRRLGVAVAAGLIAQAAIVPLYQLRHWAAYVGGRTDAAAYYARFAVWQTNPADERAAAAYLGARQRPGEPIGMWAVDAAVPFLADRPLATRFSERRVLTFAPDHEITRRYRREFVADVAARRPPYFVVNTSIDAHERPLEGAFPELGALVAARYVRDTAFGSLEVLRLRAPAGVGQPAPRGAAERAR